MRVKLSFLGILEEYTGCSELEIEMEPGSTIRDLIQRIGDRFGDCLPHHIWDSARKELTPMVGLFLDQQDVKDDNLPLKEGSELILLTMIPGG